MNKIDKLSKLQTVISNIKENNKSNHHSHRLHLERPHLQSKKKWNPVLDTHKLVQVPEQPLLQPLQDVFHLNTLQPPRSHHYSKSQANLAGYENDGLDPLMVSIKSLLDKCKKPPPQEKLKIMLSPQKAVQIYGSRRVQIESRWKEIYEQKRLDYMLCPKTEAAVTGEDAQENNKIFEEYQRRIGLTGRKVSNRFQTGRRRP